MKALEPHGKRTDFLRPDRVSFPEPKSLALDRYVDYLGLCLSINLR